MIVYKKFNIESARSLPNVSKKHPCYQIHGHSFEIIIKVEGNIDKKSGFVIDFQDIEDSFEPMRKLLDHSYLNDIKGLENPTSENMCLYIWKNIKPFLPGMIEVEIKETSTTGCKYKGD